MRYYIPTLMLALAVVAFYRLGEPSTPNEPAASEPRAAAPTAMRAVEPSSPLPARANDFGPIFARAENAAEEWREGDDYTLHVRLTKLPWPSAAEEGGPAEIEALTYNGALIGPTIRARRGTTLRIKLVNELPAEAVPAAPADPGQEDPPGELFTTNLHTH